ncbi:unnamed protein product [Caenorhabditis brenneri]
MDINDFIDRLLAMREAMQVERDEQEQTLLELRAREAELAALMNEKRMEIAAQEDTIKEKQKENDDQSDMLEELMKTRDELEREVAEINAEEPSPAPNKRSHDEDDSESRSKKKRRTSGKDEDDHQEGTSSTDVL